MPIDEMEDSRPTIERTINLKISFDEIGGTSCLAILSKMFLDDYSLALIGVTIVVLNRIQQTTLKMIVIFIVPWVLLYLFGRN